VPPTPFAQAPYPVGQPAPFPYQVVQPAPIPSQWASPGLQPLSPWTVLAPTTAKNAFGMWALICGIIPMVVLVVIFSMDFDNASAGSVLLLVLGWLVAGIIAIVTGALSMKAASRGEATNRGMGVTGLVLGIVFTVFFVLFTALAFWVA